MWWARAGVFHQDRLVDGGGRGQSDLLRVDVGAHGGEGAGEAAMDLAAEAFELAHVGVGHETSVVSMTIPRSRLALRPTLW